MSQESKKQTAVEWLVSHLNKQEWFTYKQREYIEQAKKMEQQQIVDSFVECWKANMPDGYECKLSAKQYYNEVYGKE